MTYADEKVAEIEPGNVVGEERKYDEELITAEKHYSPREAISKKYILAMELDTAILFKEISLPEQFASLSSKYFATTLHYHNESSATTRNFHFENGDVFEKLIFIAACAPLTTTMIRDEVKFGSKDGVYLIFITRVWFEAILANADTTNNERDDSDDNIISPHIHNEGDDTINVNSMFM